VKIKLDENMPSRAAMLLEAYGHDVDTTSAERLDGADDPAIAYAANLDGRLLITQDRRFADILVYPPGTHPGFS
jgi:predicted nuclease of predicted toxin-antitoxin system|tara:strand:- start:8523 stop:8744 length:222 start_codon:yes stop_codon:yes gene_type:complete